MAPPLPAFRKLESTKSKELECKSKIEEKVNYECMLNEKILESQRKAAEKATYERMLEVKVQEAQREKAFQNTIISLMDLSVPENSITILQPATNLAKVNYLALLPMEFELTTTENSDSENDSIPSSNENSSDEEMGIEEIIAERNLYKSLYLKKEYERNFKLKIKHFEEKSELNRRIEELTLESRTMSQQCSQQDPHSELEQLQQKLHKNEEWLQMITEKAQKAEQNELATMQANIEEKQQLIQAQEKVLEQEKQIRQFQNIILKQEEIIKIKQEEVQSKTTTIKNLQKKCTDNHQTNLVQKEMCSKETMTKFKYKSKAIQSYVNMVHAAIQTESEMINQRLYIANKEMCNKETMTRYKHKTKGIQSNYNTENVAIQTEIVMERALEGNLQGEDIEQVGDQCVEKLDPDKQKEKLDKQTIYQGYEDLQQLKEEIKIQLTNETTKLEEKLQKLQNTLEATKVKEITPGEVTNIMAGEWGDEELAQAAIVIKGKDYETLCKIKEILNNEIIEKQPLSIFYTKFTRNRKTLIIKSQTEEQLKGILQIIQESDYIKQTAEVNYKQQNLQKLIILGIPKSVQPEYLINSLNSLYGDTTTKIEKIKQKEASPYYQLVIVTDARLAKHLLEKGYICIGFRGCRVARFRPIVRCACCQLYGHSANNCRRQPICACCAMGHLTPNCPNANIQNLINCTNCLSNENYIPHRADSPHCPLFISLLHSRNSPTSDIVKYGSMVSPVIVHDMSQMTSGGIC